MEYKVDEAFNGKTEGSSVMVREEFSKPILSSPPKHGHADEVDSKVGQRNAQDAPLGNTDPSVEVNMEASMTTEDVIRAGGFGARDDIGSFLPVASDFTDFEATIRDSRDYEEPGGEVCRPGLGWNKATE